MLFCTRIVQCCTRVVSSCTYAVSCCPHIASSSTCVVLCCLVLYSCCLLLCRVVSCCYSCSFLLVCQKYYVTFSKKNEDNVWHNMEKYHHGLKLKQKLKSLKPLLLLIYMKCLIDTLSSNVKNALGETSVQFLID